MIPGRADPIVGVSRPESVRCELPLGEVGAGTSRRVMPGGAGPIVGVSRPESGEVGAGTSRPRVAVRRGVIDPIVGVSRPESGQVGAGGARARLGPGRAVLAAWAVALAGCYAPPVDPSAADDAGSLAGSVVVTGAGADGAVMVFLSDAADPMPPLGTGAPLDVAVVPALTGATPTGHFAFTGLPPGDYVVTALHDVDGNFHPLTGALAGATCGDEVGGHLSDTTAGTPAVVSLGSGERREDITVLIGREIPFSRPVFGLNAATPGVVPGTTDLSLRAEPVSASWVGGLSLDVAAYDPVDPCTSAFRVMIRDLDGDGRPDPHPDHADAGFLDVWPRAYLRFLGPPVDADGDGQPEGFEPATETWVSEAFPAALALAATPPEQVVARLNLPLPETSLGLLWPDAVVHESAAGDELVTDPSRIPKGAWALTLVSFTGQTWTVPNEIGGGDARSPSLAVASQRAPVWRR